MNDNYKAWEVDIKDFYDLKNTRERLFFLLNFAALAPSSHNSQPWVFRAGEKEIAVSPNFDRALPESDKNHRLLYISLGCALENILIAADYYGLGPVLDESRMTIFFSSPDGNTGDEEGGKKNHLIFSIPRRKTNRNNYEERMPMKVLFLGRAV